MYPRDTVVKMYRISLIVPGDYARRDKRHRCDSPAESCARHPASPARRISPRSRRRPGRRRPDAVFSVDGPMPIYRTAVARSIVCCHLRNRPDTSERCECHGHRGPRSFPTRRTRAATLFVALCCPRRASARRGRSPRSSSRATIAATWDRRP